MHTEIRQLFVIGMVAMVAALLLGIAVKTGDMNSLTGYAIMDINDLPNYFAPAWDFFDSNTRLVTFNNYVDNSQDTFDIDIDVNHVGGYIYKTGYYLSGNEWHQFNFTDTLPGTDWVAESATHHITDTYDGHVIIFDDDEFVVATYTCKQQVGEWKCGCSDNVCDTPGTNSNKWMIESYDLETQWTVDHINISNPTHDVTVGSDFDLNLDIYSSGTIYGYEFTIEYDPAVISYVGSSDGTYLGNTGYHPGNSTSGTYDFLCINESVDTVTGRTTKIACTMTGNSVSPPVPGAIIKTITMHADAAGYSQVRVVDAQFASWVNIVTDPAPSIRSVPSNNEYVRVSS